MKFLIHVSVIWCVVNHNYARRLGGTELHHHGDHHEAEHHHHHQDHSSLEDNIAALESSIESVYADPGSNHHDHHHDHDHQDSSSSTNQQSFTTFQDIPFNSISDKSNDLDLSEYEVAEANFSLPLTDEDEEELQELDFSKASPTLLDDGTTKNCMEKEAFREELKKDPVLSCVHKTVEKCHYTYTTQFVPVTEEVCDEHYEKHCSITYKQVVQNDTLLHCYNPLVRQCPETEEGEEECRDYYETSCTTRYVEKSPGKFLGDTACEKVPVNYCTKQSCEMVAGPQECHDKVVLSVIDQPEEHCDLVPQKSCRHKTTLIPKLKPEPECVDVPQEICDIKYVNVRVEEVAYTTLWCQDEEGNVGEGRLPDPALVLDTPLTDGYEYEVPENPLTPPPRTTTSLPVVPEEPEIVAPPPPTPAPAPGPSNTVQLTPADLQAAITEAIRRSVTAAVNRQLELQLAARNKEALEASIRESVLEAVRRAVIKSVESQAASNQLQTSRDLETAVSQAVRAAVEQAVIKMIGSTNAQTKNMKTAMLDIESQVEAAVIEAIRRAVTGAVSERRPAVITENNIPQTDDVPAVTAVEDAVRSSIRKVVAAAVKSRTQGLTQSMRQDINTGIQTAVQTSINQEMRTASEGENVDIIRQAVTAAVMQAVRSAVEQQSRTSSSSSSASSQSQILVQKLNNAVRQAVQNQLRRRFSV